MTLQYRRNDRHVGTTVRFLYPHSSHNQLAYVLEERGYRVIFEKKKTGGISAASDEILSIAIVSIDAISALFSIAGIVREWLEERQLEERQKEGPQIVVIYGPDGQELGRVERAKK